MCYRYEIVIGVFQKRMGSFDLANAMDQPVDLHLQNPCNLGQSIETGFRGAATQDVIDEGPIDTSQLGEMRRAQAELVCSGLEALSQGVVFFHLIPKGLWIELDKI